MAALILPSRWTRQPTSWVDVDKSTPLAYGLRGVFSRLSGGSPRIGVVSPSSDSSLSRSGYSGIGSDYASTANTQFASTATGGSGIAGAMSFFALLDIDTLTNYGNVIAQQNSSTVAGYEIRLGNAPTEGNFLIHRGAAASYSQYRCTNTVFTAGSVGVTASFSSDGNLGNAPVPVVNGVVQATTLVQSASGTQTASTSNIWVGRRSDGATQLDGCIYLIYLWDRQLSVGEQLALHKNPWQLFQPLSRRFYSRPAVAPGIPTLSAAAVANIQATQATPRVTVTY